MNAPKKNTAAKGLLGWWLSPPRSGVQRVIAPWEYRHLRAFAATRLAGAGAAGAAGIVCLPYEAYGWAAGFGVSPAELFVFAGGRVRGCIRAFEG